MPGMCSEETDICSCGQQREQGAGRVKEALLMWDMSILKETVGAFLFSGQQPVEMPGLVARCKEGFVSAMPGCYQSRESLCQPLFENTECIGAGRSSRAVMVCPSAELLLSAV